MFLLNLLKILLLLYFLMFCFFKKGHVGSWPQTRDQTCTLCIWRQSLNHLPAIRVELTFSSKLSHYYLTLWALFPTLDIATLFTLCSALKDEWNPFCWASYKEGMCNLLTGSSVITAQGVWGKREERSRNLPERKRISLSATWMDLKITAI